MNADETVKQLEAAFKKVDRKVNMILFIFLAIMLPLSMLYDKSALKCWQMDILHVVLFVGTLFFLIRHLVVAKKKICIQFGLACPFCGKTPKAFFAISSLKTGTCFSCKKKFER